MLVSADLLRSPLARATLQQLNNLLQVLRVLGKGLAMQFLFDRVNQLGAWDMGVLPAVLPGLRAVTDDAARATLERAWGAEIPSEPGADFDAMLELCDTGRIGALYIAGSDPLMSYPDREFVQRALRAADLLIVQDAFLTDTAGVADVVLPAASYGEESGTFTNNEGRIQKVCKFREPALDARGNLAIFDFVAALRNQALRPSVQREIFDEIARLVPAYEGLTQDRLGADGAFTKASRVPPVGEFFAPPLAPIATDRLMLITGNCLFHNGYLSEHSEILNTVADDPYVEMSARDAVTARPFGWRSSGRAIRPKRADRAAKGQQAFPHGPRVRSRKLQSPASQRTDAAGRISMPGERSKGARSLRDRHRRRCRGGTRDLS